MGLSLRIGILISLCFLGMQADWALAEEGDRLSQDRVYMDLRYGRVVIDLDRKSAPLHVERIIQLVEEGFYDGVIFHRVISGFMAQTGDPTGTGGGGSPYPDLPAEFSDLPFKRGTLGMARSSDPNSANSQFFICFEDAHWLNGDYTVIGQVVEGMEYVDRIAKGEPPASPDTIEKMSLASSSAAEPYELSP